MIVTTPDNMPIVEITLARHPTLGSCLKVGQNSVRYVLVPLDSITGLADSLIDAVERIEQRCG